MTPTVQRFVIRADASNHLGSGHVMRCLSLADALKDAGAEVVFACREQTGNLNALLRERGYSVYALSGAGAQQGGQITSSEFDHEQDVEQMMPVLRREKPDWLIVDHYGLDEVWENALRPYVGRIMVIDDLADREHACDLLLDQNYDESGRYSSRVPEGCRLLLGPHFALLKPQYAEARERCLPRVGEVERVLIFFGGSDECDMTGRTVKALGGGILGSLKLDVVVGQNYAHLEALRELVSCRGNAEIHSPRSHLADLMEKADLAIGAGGVTNWERMCVGLPSIVVAIAENQVPISRILGDIGAICYLGREQEVTVESLRQSLIQEMSDMRALKRSRIASEMCDGRGLSRVVDVLLDQSAKIDIGKQECNEQ